MRAECPVCGKGFWCDYPHLWAYKREKLFLCSWKCIREYDRKEAEKMAYRKIRKDGTPAKPTRKRKEEKKIELVYDESIAEEYRREQAKKEANARAKAEEKAGLCETKDEKLIWHTTAIANNEMGEFYYDRKYKTVDWRHPAGEEISLPPEEWRRLAEKIPQILHVLGADD